jgi:hypothetical protein
MNLDDIVKLWHQIHDGNISYTTDIEAVEEEAE